MGKHNHYKAQQFIDAIPGTGGIITTIAARVGCAWHTAKKYIEEYATIKRAYENEIELVGDIAESVIIGNIKIAYEKQRKKKEPADSSDAKWYLTRKGKDRGYTERTEITGAKGGPIEHEDVGFTNEQRMAGFMALYDAVRARVLAQTDDGEPDMGSPARTAGSDVSSSS